MNKKIFVMIKFELILFKHKKLLNIIKQQKIVNYKKSAKNIF